MSRFKLLIEYFLKDGSTCVHVLLCEGMMIKYNGVDGHGNDEGSIDVHYCYQ